MTTTEARLRAMLQAVAQALGEDLLERVAFVGGSTTALFLTDPISLQGVRYTLDVDLIVGVDSLAQWAEFQDQLQARGFRASPEDEVICRMRLGELKVDFMPRDATVLGFTNRWYRAALAAALPFDLTPETRINLLQPAYFLATKLEAWLGRGSNDPLASHDLEDIITLVDGREELPDDLLSAPNDLRRYIAGQFRHLLDHPGFEYALLGNLQDPARAEIVLKRFDRIARENAT